MRRLAKFLGWVIASAFALAAIGLILFFIFAPGKVDAQRNPVIAHDPYVISDQAQALHDTLIVGDLHADPTLWKRDLLVRNDHGHVDIPRLIEGNVALQVFTAVTKSPADLNYEANDANARDNITLLAMGQLWPKRTWNSIYQRAIYQADKLHQFAERSDDTLRVITSRAELDQLLADRAAGHNVVGGFLGIEGSHPLEGDLSNLDGIMAAGHRVIALQHFFDNKLGGSLHGTGFLGLTDFGRQVVQQVEQRGLILDVAHSSTGVVRDILAMTDMPIILSHTGIYSHCPSRRNIPDDLMRAVAQKGGVIGIGFWADVTCDASPGGIADAIIAAITLVGVDHVALGSDFDGTVTTMLDASELAAITQALLDRGQSETAIRKVMGENMVRVFRARLD
ncbi:MAG: dipeptidase [Planktomarina sp.]